MIPEIPTDKPQAKATDLPVIPIRDARNTREIKSRDTISYEKPGKYEGLTKKDYTQKLKVENLIERASQAKDFRGYLHGTIKVAQADNNTELVLFLTDLLRKFEEYEKIAGIKLDAWRGKSSFQMIRKPDKIITIKYSRPDRDSEPKEQRVEITKEELNILIIILNRYKKGDKIDTKILADEYCRYAKITKNNEGRNLFDGKGKFIWQTFFADRRKHIHFNRMLRVFDKIELIKYRGSTSEILVDSMDVEEVLNG